jgi:glycosyltransferase involved in cell wall biosynthesis
MFSIIIPYKTKDSFVERCLKCISYQTYKDYEVIEVPDLICDGYPSEKRNWAIKRAKGDYLAFIDSDAYPPEDWLDNALMILRLGYIGVCGPGVLPYDASLLEQATDLVYKCLPFSYRVTPKAHRIVTDFPTFNLVVKKTDLQFQPYLTGEDTLYCKELSERGKILYTPILTVYHYRRPLFRPYWKQISIYGFHRGHLIRLAVAGLATTVVIYATNFIKGFLRRKI